jgi:phosphoglycerate dehydrogenase-like enzyme
MCTYVASRMVSVLALGCYALTATHVALLGSYNNLGPNPVAQITKHMQTTQNWRFLHEATTHDAGVLATVDVCVNCFNASLFARMPKATVAQYEYTGISTAQLAAVPPRFACANCHQSAVPIAEFLLANMLELTVGVRAQEARIRNCTWKSEAPGNCADPNWMRLGHRQLWQGNMTLGIIGYGSIGKELAVRAAPLGLRVIATTLGPPSSPPAPLAWLGNDSMNARLMAESDFVVLACPLTPATEGMVGAELLRAMRPDAWIMNVARGAVLQQDALWDALQPTAAPGGGSAIGGAVLDVWWNSVFRLEAGGVGPENWPSAHRFDELPNVIVTPHSSSSTPQSTVYSAACVAANLDHFALGQPLENVIRNASASAAGRPAAVTAPATPPPSAGEGKAVAEVTLGSAEALAQLAAGQEVSFRVGTETRRFRLAAV